MIARTGSVLCFAALSCSVGVAAQESAGCSDLHPFWSPDGRSLVFFESCAEGATNLVLEAADGERRQLTEDGRSSLPVWSPDGEQLAFLRQEERGLALFVLDLDSGAETRLAPLDSARPAGVLAWHPGGREIAVTDRRDGERVVLLADPSDGGVRDLPGGLPGDSDPSWHPDGSGALAVAHGSSIVLLTPAGERETLELGAGVHFYPQFEPSGVGLFLISDSSGSPDAYYVGLRSSVRCLVAAGEGFQGEAVKSSATGEVAYVDTSGGSARIVRRPDPCAAD